MDAIEGNRGHNRHGGNHEHQDQPQPSAQVFRSKSQSRVRSRVANSRAMGIGKADHNQFTPQNSMSPHQAAKRPARSKLNSAASTPLRKSIQQNCPTARQTMTYPKTPRTT